MKKLLSICFLSILLGLMSFSMRAQSSGFWIENLNPVTVDGVVNAPDGSGTLVLNNTMNVAREDSVDLYELHFCTEVPDSLKISVDWLLYRNGQLVNGNLSDYAEIDMYTWYPELNNQGDAMAIHWVGGRLPNAFGYCDQPVQPDMFSGYDCGHAPTNYPGALQVGQGTPHSVLNALDEWVNAQGLYSIYTESFDYFYAKFFQYGRTVVQIKWKQAGNYSLVMRIRERRGGTDWYNAYYNNDERLHVGGHMSCCGEVLASDSIHYLVTGEFSKEVCQDAVPFTYGNPPYDFYETMEDTNVVFGHNDPLHCDIFVVDSIIDFHFFVRHNPVVRVATHVDTLCSCDPYIPEDIFGVTLDPVDLDVASDTAILWYTWGANGYDWYETSGYYNPMTRKTQTDTTYVFIVRQVNTYNNFDEEVVCEGKIDTMYLTIKRIEAPELSDNLEVCLEAIDSTSVHHATSTHDARCSTTTRWYTKLTTGITTQLSAWIDLNSLVYVGDDFPINLLQYAPTTNVDKKVTFYAVSYNDSTGCMSKYFTRYEIQYHQTPVISKVTSPDTINCPGAEVTMKVKVDNNNATTDKPFTYMWNGVSNILMNGTKVPFVDEIQKTVQGSPATSANKYVPMSISSNYNYSQQIFTADEVGKGLITKIAFECKSGTNFTKNNVSILLAPTTQDNYGLTGKTWVTEGFETVFNGTITANAAGWCTITLDHPYVFDGLTNLVVAVSDASGAHGTGSFAMSYNQSTTSPDYYKTLYVYGNNPVGVDNNPTARITQRSNIRFTIESTDFTTNTKNQEAYFNIPDTAKCNDSYTSSVYVINNHGCVSQPVEFNYGVGVRTAPRVVNVPTAPAKIYVCELNADSIPAYTTIEDVTAAGIRVIDECGKGMTVTHTDAMFRGDCHDTLVRVYTIHNLCDSTVSFTLTYISYDTVKPVFVRDTMELPLVQLRPLPGGNCTYNSPDSMDFVNAVAAMVYDDCTDSAFLMSTLEFFWENTTKSPINDTNIFRVNNHLTVTAVIHDICNNYSDSTLVIYLDLPDTMWISGDPTVLPTVCEGVTPENLVFDTTLIHSDAFVGPYLPYTYEWSEVNGREVTFTNKYAKETGINPVGSGDFVFQLKVTDNNGCSALSAYYFLHVNPIPNIHVTEIPYGGATRPYCPTYGWMTVGVFDANTGNRYPASANMSYTWEGEGVNIHSIFDTTIVNIVPDSCDHDYMAIVTVADEIGCSATDTVIFPVRDTEGPIILPGVLHDTVLIANNECKFTVPNYRNFLNASNVTSKCGYSPTKILETYVQVPAAGSLVTKDTTAIKITLTTPCGKDSVYTVYAFRPDDYVTVNVTVNGDSVCENDPTYLQNGITLTANAQNGTAPYTYAWTKGASTTVIGTDATLTVHDTNGVYTYHVAVKDAHNCPVGDEADITVWFKGAPAITQVTPNRICDGHNGTLTILEAPTGYTYNFQGQTKISDNASHEPTINNTVYFADLYPGTFTLTITTNDPENCETTKEITIPNVTAEVDTVVATPLAVSNCLDNNGAITITRQEGYTYYFSNDGGVTYVDTDATVISGLSSGTYWFYRVNDATNCESPRTSVYVPYNAPSFDFTINSVVNNSYCYDNQADGTFKLATPGVNYYVTLNNDSIYEGLTTTLTGLYAGTYTIVGTSTSNGCIKTKTQTITNGKRSYPSANVATTPNRYCDPTQANGTITVTKTSSSPVFTYTVLNGTDTVQPADYNSLYAGTYTVNMITEKGCTGTTSKAVGENKVNPNVTATAKTNSTCIPEDFDGKITLTVTNATASQAGTSFTYMLWQTGSDTTTQTNGTFTGLASGAYNYAVVSQYGCAKTGNKTVDQYKVPALDLDSTANFMCEPTATKPGDGTITIMAPRNSNTKHYHYKYYDAAGNEYDVPFDEPFVYTLYWLADGMYRVTALELETNCMAEDSIYVPLDRYNVNITANATGNKYCTKNFDGTITVNANSSNPDAILQYKLVGVNNDYTSEYTFNTVFTGLQDGIYQVMVRDTNTACVYVMEENVEVEKLANDITITPTITPDHACEGGNHDGTLSVVASTTTFDNTFFMFKFNQDADFSTTSSWTGLNSSTRYNVTVIDTISGCTVDSIFSIPLENVCAPIITINGNNKFCLNAEDAQICATATNNTDVCPEGNYQFMWVIRCHHDTVYNQCVDVNTSSVHNCFYDLYVKDMNTGCVSNKSIEVEILPINQVNFTINHVPFYADPRTYEHCVADSVWVGVKKDKWVSVLWSNGYVTPDDKKPLDLEFCVPANTNTPNHQYTYCVDAIDSNGCPARSEINLWANPVPQTTVHDTACYEFRFGNEVIAYSDDVQYPITRTQVFPRRDSKHCDSVVTHEIVIYPHVYANFDAVTLKLQDVYCAPTNILSELKDSVKYNHGTLSVEIKNGNNWRTFNQLNNLTYNYSDSTFRFFVDGRCEDKSYEFQISMDKAPQIDTFKLNTYYCASSEATFKAVVSEFSNIHTQTPSSSYVKMYFANDEAHPFTCTNPTNKVNGKLQKFYFDYTPTMADNGRKIVTKVWNNCGTVTDTQLLVVDTTFINILDHTYCEDDVINYADYFNVANYQNVVGYIMNVVDSTEVIPMVDLDFSEYFSGVSGSGSFTSNTFHLGNIVDAYIAMTGGTQPAYYASDHTLRFYQNNTITFTPEPGYEINRIKINATRGNDLTLKIGNVDQPNVSRTSGAYLVDNLHAQTNVTLRNNAVGADQARFTTIEVIFTELSNPAHTYTYTYGPARQYQGEQLSMSENHAKVYFTADSKCGNITSDTAVITVKPKPVLNVTNPTAELCLEEAADSIANCVSVQHADVTKWYYKLPAAQPVWTEDFENGFPQGWVRIGDQNGNWNVINNSGAHSGSKLLNAPAYYYGQNKWLFTPAIHADQGMNFEFFVKSSGTARSYYEVYVLNTNTVPSGTTGRVIASTRSNTSWTRQNVNLSSYAGQDVYIAIHNSYSTWSNDLYFDDMTLYGQYVAVNSLEELIDSIKNMPQAEVYYYAANDCGSEFKKVGTFRILDTVKLTASSVTACPNDDLSDITSALDARIIDYGNYRTNEIKPVAVGNDGNLYDLNSHVALTTVMHNGVIRIVPTSTNPQVDIDFCGFDTAKATITVLTNGFKQDTLQVACDATEFANFIKAAPVWTGSVTVQNNIEHQFWTVNYIDNQLPVSKVITTDSIMHANQHPQVYYTWITDCGDTLRTSTKTLVFYTNPELTLTPDTVHICLNDTLFINNLGLGLYDPDEITKGHDTVWTLLGETVTDYVVATEAMNGAALYATIESTCETAFDSIIVMVDTLPVVTITGPNVVCNGVDVTYTATPGFDSYVFVINDVEQPEQRPDVMGADAYSITTTATAETVSFIYANVIVTDGNQCKASAAEDAATRVTAMPRFVFFDSTGMANATTDINGGKYNMDDETHHFTATTGNGMKYVWMVNNECYNPDTLVYVEYDFYFNGQKISNDSIDDWYLIPSTYNYHGQSPLWVTSNQVFWEANDHTAKNNIAYYNYAVGDPSIYVNLNEYGGNHYPNTNMGFSNSNVYDDLWMHFLAGRPVTQEISGFRRQGEYKVVFRLYATSNPNKFYHPYTHTNEDGTTQMMYIGGSNANANDAIITLLAMDSITIDVTGEDVIDPSVITPNDAPILAPELTVDETVAPDMEVWPNPAPATVTTLKARVHNVSGNAVVTLSNLNGKQVYNGNLYIDNDNYYFEFGVNNLSVGTYILTVRTDDAVLTKKVVVTVLR